MISSLDTSIALDDVQEVDWAERYQLSSEFLLFEFNFASVDKFVKKRQ